MPEGGMELLQHGLRDVYDAEHRFVEALETMISQVSDESLEDGFRRHLKQTKEQIRRLDRVFDELDETPGREDCPGSKGLIAEYQKFVKEGKPQGDVLNAFAAEAGLKVEHYEMVAYRSLINLAAFCGYDEVARLLRQNLVEEEQAAAELTSASERLSAQLTGAGGTGIVRRAAGTLFDQMREGGLAAAGTAKTVGEYAVRRTGEAVDQAERRGRRAVRSAQARGRTARAKSGGRSTTSRARATTRRKSTTSSGRSRATARGRSTARKTSTSRGGTSRSTARRTTGSRRRTTRARASSSRSR
jgi:ferritin-like metal-binding protein YciE